MDTAQPLGGENTKSVQQYVDEAKAIYLDGKKLPVEPRHQRIGIIFLAAGIGKVSSDLSSFDEIAPKGKVATRADAKDAISKSRELWKHRYEAGRWANAMPRKRASLRIVLAIHEELSILDDVIGQCEIPAEMAIHDGEFKEAVEIIRTSVWRGHRRSGARLQRLEARVRSYLRTYMPEETFEAAREMQKVADRLRTELLPIPTDPNELDLWTRLANNAILPESEQRSERQIASDFVKSDPSRGRALYDVLRKRVYRSKTCRPWKQ